METKNHAEKELKYSEETYRTLIENIQDGIFLIQDAKIQFANEAFARIAGYTLKEVIGGDFRDFVAPEDLEMVANRYHRRQAGENIPKEYEFSVLQKDGITRRTVNMNVGLVNYRGRVASMGTVKDITERKQADETMKHRLVVEKTIASVSTRFINLSDFDNAVSTTLEDVGRLSKASRCYLFLFRENGNIMDNTYEWCADDVRHEIKNLKNLPASMYPWWMTKLHANEIIHITDVSKLPPEATSEKEILEMQDIKSLIVLPVYAGMELAGFIGLDNVVATGYWPEEELILLRIASDIIGNALQRLQAEAALQKSEARMRLQINRMPIGCIVWNLDCSITAWNPAAEEIFGFKAEEVKGKHPYDLIVSGDVQPHTDTIWRRLLEGDTTAHSVNENITRDGRTIICAWSNTPLREADGKIIGVISMVQDITERKQAEEQIKQSLKEKEILLREIHHRVKNNMQIVSSLLRLQSGYIKDEKYREMLMDSQDRIMTMSLVHEKLYQSKNFAKIDIKDYIRDLVICLFQNHGVTKDMIGLNISVQEVSIGVDYAIPCGLIISELITNSLKYAFPDGRKGEIDIVLHKAAEDEIKLIVSDNGIGIPEGVDFRKTESLGMYLVRILAENQLHGVIDLNRSKGTEFKIKFKGMK